MPSLFDKLATLVNAHVNEVLGNNPQSPLARIKLNPETAAKDPRRSAQSLGRRLEEAVEYEDVLIAKVGGLMQQALDIDQQVDESLSDGNTIEARRLQGQLNTKQQQLTIAESELREHRLLTRRLMQELRSLESALDRHDQAAASAGSQQTRIPVDGAASPASASDKSILGAVSDKFHETRGSLESLLNRPEAPAQSRRYEKFDIVEEAPDPRRPKTQKRDAADMNRRLSRLRKPSNDEK